jgi:O-antigen ligase
MIGVILASAFPYGSAREWAWLGVLSLLLAGASITIARHPDTFTTNVTRQIWLLPSLFFSLALLWGLLQWLPVLPIDISHPLWPQTHDTIGNVNYHSISLNPSQSGLTWLRMASYGVLLFMLLHTLRVYPRPAQILHVIIMAVTFYALYGLLFHMQGSNMVLFTPKWTHIGDLTSTFMNRNNYATFAGMGLLVSLGLLLDTTRQYIRPDYGWRMATRYFFQQFFQLRPLLLLLATIVILSSLLLTHSRAGITATAIAGLVLILLSGRSWIKKNRWMALVLIGIAMSFVTFIFATNPQVWARIMRTDLEREQRIVVYERTQEIIANNAIVGHGLGTFREIHRLHNAPPIAVSYDRALNDYLEIALELGVIGAGFVLLSLLWLVYQCWKGYQRRKKGRLYPALGISASVLVGLHALTDASLQVPAVALLYILLLAFALGQSLPSTKTTR